MLVPMKETMNSPRITFNWGFWDARSDTENGRRDRRNVPVGELFCLPEGSLPDAIAYRAGYDYGFRFEYKEETLSDRAWANWRINQELASR